MNIIKLELNKIIKYLGIFTLICVFSSCITTKELEYFRTQKNDELVYVFSDMANVPILKLNSIES